MTRDLFYLTLSAGLCAVLWVPYVVGRLETFGQSADDYRDMPEHDQPAWLRRAYRAHINMVESLPAFAALVLVAHLAGEASSVTAMAALVFFWARVAHAVVFFAGWPYVRTLTFAVGWLANIAILWEILA